MNIAYLTVSEEKASPHLRFDLLTLCENGPSNEVAC